MTDTNVLSVVITGEAAPAAVVTEVRLIAMLAISALAALNRRVRAISSVSWKYARDRHAVMRCATRCRS